jgi:hypothetical protein
LQRHGYTSIHEESGAALIRDPCKRTRALCERVSRRMLHPQMHRDPAAARTHDRGRSGVESCARHDVIVRDDMQPS